MLNKIMRMALTPLLVMGLILIGVGMTFVAPEEGLSDLQIREKLDEIGDRYEVGEELSEEDASFVKEHAASLSKNRVQTMAEGHIDYFRLALIFIICIIMVKLAVMLILKLKRK